MRGLAAASGARTTNQQPTAALVLVMILAVATLVPPPCVKEYNQFVKWSENLEDSPRYDGMEKVVAAAAAQTPLYIGPLPVRNNSKTVDIGLQALVDNGYPLQPVSKVLPKKLFLIYGLESSGTTFTAKTIATALGLKTERMGDRMGKGDIEVHHISLPTGWEGDAKKPNWGFETRFTKPLLTVPVYYPNKCILNGDVRKPPAFKTPSLECQEVLPEAVMTAPGRHFINITSSVHWYRERGVRVYPVMVVRDPMLHFQGVLKQHCRNETVAYQQYEQGRSIMFESVEKGVNPLIISYESMLTLQKPYLHRLYHDLGIESTYTPDFRNGNTKYVSPNDNRPDIEQALMKEDPPPEPPKKPQYSPLVIGGRPLDRSRIRGPSSQLTKRTTKANVATVHDYLLRRQQERLGKIAPSTKGSITVHAPNTNVVANNINPHASPPRLHKRPHLVRASAGHPFVF